VADGSVATDLTVNAALSGTGRLLKQGAGTLTLSGASPSYTGTMRVDAGTLLANGSSSSSPVLLNGGTLGGTGTLGPLSNVAGVASTFSPGLPGAPGRLIVNGDLALGSGATYAEQLNGTTAVSTSDLVDVHGLVKLSNPVLQVSLGFPSAVNDNFVLVLN